jgi:hypothetical protein
MNAYVSELARLNELSEESLQLRVPCLLAVLSLLCVAHVLRPQHRVQEVANHRRLRLAGKRVVVQQLDALLATRQACRVSDESQNTNTTKYAKQTKNETTTNN